MLGYCVEKMGLTGKPLPSSQQHNREKGEASEKISCRYSLQQLGAHMEGREDGVRAGATANNKIIAE